MISIPTWFVIPVLLVMLFGVVKLAKFLFMR